MKYRTKAWSSTSAPMNHRYQSKKFHHGFKPYQDVEEHWRNRRYPITTNSLGFKDTSTREIPLSDVKPRLLLMGDSFTEGIGYPFEKTFAGIISQQLAQKGVGVLNGAVKSYSPIIYFLKIRYLIEQLGLDIDHVVIFLDISDIYDEATRYKTDDHGYLVTSQAPVNLPSELSQLIRENSLIGRLVTQLKVRIFYLYSTLKRKYLAAKALNKTIFEVTNAEMLIQDVSSINVSSWTYDDKAWEGFAKRGRESARANMDKLSKFLQDRGIKHTLVVYPWPDQILNDPDALRHEDFWRKWSHQKGIQFISLFPNFTSHDPRETISEYFLPGDFHWNEKGHALVAKEMLRHLPDLN